MKVLVYFIVLLKIFRSPSRFTVTVPECCRKDLWQVVEGWSTTGRSRTHHEKRKKIVLGLALRNFIGFSKKKDWGKTPTFVDIVEKSPGPYKLLKSIIHELFISFLFIKLIIFFEDSFNLNSWHKSSVSLHLFLSFGSETNLYVSK